jgi:hypothetical protein
MVPHVPGRVRPLTQSQMGVKVKSQLNCIFAPCALGAKAVMGFVPVSRPGKMPHSRVGICGLNPYILRRMCRAIAATPLRQFYSACISLHDLDACISQGVKRKLAENYSLLLLRDAQVS